MDKRFAKDCEYFNAYQKAFAFHKKHAGIKNDDEWLSCTADLGQFKTPFEQALSVAILDELERDCNSHGQILAI